MTHSLPESTFWWDPIPPPATQKRLRRNDWSRLGSEPGQSVIVRISPLAKPHPPGVFANRPLRSVGEFSYAYNLLDAV